MAPKTPEQRTMDWLNKNRPSWNGNTLTKRAPHRAKNRVVLAKVSDPWDRIYAILNPQSLPQEISVDYGSLRPIGSSHPVKMYGSTGDITTTLDLHLSQFFMKALDYTSVPGATTDNASIEDQIVWLYQFCYPQERQVAPPVMLLAWPNVLTMAFIVEGISVERTRFDTQLRTQIADVSMKISSLQQNFINSKTMLENGFKTPVEGYGLNGPGSYRLGRTGTPLNLTHISNKKGRR